MKVLCLTRYDAAGSSSRYRMYQFLPSLRDAGVQVDEAPLLDASYIEALYGGRRRSALQLLRAALRRIRQVASARSYDLIWIEKELLPFVPGVVERLLLLRAAGTPVVVDYDDATFHRYDRHSSPLVRALLGRKVDRIMAAADLVIAGNAYLAAHARAAGAPAVEILPTVIDVDRYPSAPLPAHAGLTVGWIGSPTTQAHLEHVAPALASFCAERGARVHLIGATKGFTLRGVPVEAVPWSSDGEVAALRQLDIGIMPLPDSPWERGKCGFKLIQYMACGLPVIASPVGANLEIVADGETGFLARSDEEWLASLRALGDSADLRARMGAAGRARLEARYTLQVVAPRLTGLLCDAAAAARPTRSASPPPPRSIAANTALNLAGMLAPLAAAVVAIPHLNRFLGTDRVGFLTLAWALIGYVSLFDLGIGRALTKLVAETLDAADEPRVARLIWTALAIMLGLGVLAGLAIAAGADWLVASALLIPPALQPEAVVAVRVLALTVPLVVTSAGLRGVLEAQGRFLVSNAVRTPLGVWLIVSPLLLWPLGTRSLAAVAVLLFVGRLAAWIAYGVACVRSIPNLLAGFSLDRRQVGPLLRFGGWMTISSVISPLMVYLDRFILGHGASLQVVASYTIPFEVVTKLLVIPGAVVTVLFPLFSSLTSQGRGEASRLYRLGTRYMALAMFVPTFAASLFAREGLELWLGPEFADAAHHVVQLIALGCLLNGIATVPFALLQGAGRPDVTAKIHLVELPAYLALVVGLTLRFGITGTALAWALRMGLDLILLLLLARRTSAPSGVPTRPQLAAAAIAAAVFATSLLPAPLVAKGILFTAVVLAEAILIWTVLLDRDGLGHVKRQVLGILR